MNSWQLIFLQSRANHGAYDGDKLPAQIWDWPRGTWFQKRRRYLRETQSQIPQRIDQNETQKTKTRSVVFTRLKYKSYPNQSSTDN
jgi:hypothetical protein